jgi:hypothetical protein
MVSSVRLKELKLKIADYLDELGFEPLFQRFEIAIQCKF